ncbi:MAG: cytochrome bd-I oxidase subunit CydX [Pseudomonadota bacterium]|nr:cytochrome bd-I oxidase subunit CydX [Pseudomonadota bacterium]
MWYFSWILGLGLAVTFGILNAMWYEVRADAAQQGNDAESPAVPVQDR